MGISILWFKRGNMHKVARIFAYFHIFRTIIANFNIFLHIFLYFYTTFINLSGYLSKLHV